MSVNFPDPEQVSYRVDGNTLASVAQVIAQKDEAGKTQYWPNYAYDLNGNDIASVTVTVKTRITLPEWSGYSSASQPEKDEWDRFCSALQRHEQGHVDLVQQYLSGIDQQMIGQPLKDAQAAWQAALDALASATQAYDNQSDHGRNQGTVIDLSVLPS